MARCVCLSTGRYENRVSQATGRIGYKRLGKCELLKFKGEIVGQKIYIAWFWCISFGQLLNKRKCLLAWGVLSLLILPNKAIAAPNISNNLNPPASPYCRVDTKEIIAKANLLKAATNGDRQALSEYNRLVKTHAAQLAQCRQAKWPAVQGVWMRVYPCDLQAGKLEQVLDNIANFGYNRIYLNTFYDGRVLLPTSDNPTVWPSVVGSEAKDADLLAEVITKAHQRGIKVHAWVFSMNFGPSYAKRQDRQGAIARNAYGESNLQDPQGLPEESKVSHIFIDPYSKQAKEDLRVLVKAMSLRKPDAIMFDYIRYPHRVGAGSIVTEVRDLMIYGASSATAFLNRASTAQGQELLYQYLAQGKVDNNKVDRQIPLWKFPNRSPHLDLSKLNLQQELWQLALSHARAGVIEFLESATQPARQNNIPTGAAFFPKANIAFGNYGADARLQPWQEFTSVSEWAPMNYSACGSSTCIIDEISLVMQQNSSNRVVCPILMGYWARNQGDRLALETQMDAVYRAYPQLNCVSHFAYSWLNLEQDQQRRSCKLPRGDN